MMTPEERIKRLEAVNTRLELKVRELSKKNDALIRSSNTYSRDRWYIAYLQVSLMQLEAQYAERQEHIDTLLQVNQRLREVTESFTVDNV